jgi:tripartite-type tricarboxylate transporter receptor subunit TctC
MNFKTHTGHGLTVASLVLAVALLRLLTGYDPALAAESFYQGKAMRIVVGAAPGGGFDVY